MKMKIFIPGIILLSVAATAGALSFMMNVTAGLSVSIAVAIAFGLSDVVKVLVPMTCQAIGWNSHLRIIYIAASVISIACASLYLADQFGTVIAEKQNVSAIVNQTESQITDIRASLRDARSMALAESKRGGCGPKCEALNQRVTDLETELKNAIAARKNVSVADATDGKAKLLSDVLGTDENTASKTLSIVLIVAALIIGELCTHLSGYAANMIGQSFKKEQPVKERRTAHTVAKIKADALTPANAKARLTAYEKRSAAAKKGWETRRRNAALKAQKTDWTKAEAYTKHKELETA